MTIANNMEIYKTFVIESAHRLPNLPENHKCSRLHGHSFVIEVHVSGSNDNTNGWVMDFADIGKIFQPIYKRLDHSRPRVLFLMHDGLLPASKQTELVM